MFQDTSQTAEPVPLGAFPPLILADRPFLLLPKENLVEGLYFQVVYLIFFRLMLISLFAVKMCSGKMLQSAVIQ